MADLIIGRRDKPVTIHASRECAKTLRENMFNNALWPDFTAHPHARRTRCCDQALPGRQHLPGRPLHGAVASR